MIKMMMIEMTMLLMMAMMSVSALPFQPSSDFQSVPPTAGQSGVQLRPGPGKSGRETQDQINGRGVILSSAVHDSTAERSDHSDYTASHVNNALQV